MFQLCTWILNQVKRAMYSEYLHFETALAQTEDWHMLLPDLLFKTMRTTFNTAKQNIL